MGKKLPRIQASMRRHPRPGVCYWCRCVEDDACPGGCSWVNREQTLCSMCVLVDQAWRSLQGSRPPNMTYAFYRGFLIGSDDMRAFDLVGNPYPDGGRAHQFWGYGKAAGGALPK